jgi:hypothetical protein
MTEADYRAAPGLNHSLLKKMHPTPAHCRQEQVAPLESTDAQVLGQVFHAALLEPASFHGRYFRAPGVDRRTKEGRLQWAEAVAANEGREPVKADDYDWIERACETLWASSTVQALLGGQGMNEVSAFWDLEVGGQPVRCKGRIDRLTKLESASLVVDVKTTRSAAIEPFMRDVAAYSYHTQAAYYLDGLDALAPRHRDWIWIAVEKEPPFAHAFYQPLPEVVEAGRQTYRRWLARYVACAAANDWPGYPREVQPLDLPPWTYRSADLEF